MVEWLNIYGGSSPDWGWCMDITADGGYYLAGSSSSTDGDVIGLNGGSDVNVYRVDVDGAIIWQNCYGGSNNETAYTIRTAPDGGCFIAATSTSSDGDVSSNNGNRDAWVMRLNATGGIIWQRSFGSANEDWAAGLDLTSDGGCVVSGKSGSVNGDVTSNQGGSDYWIIKLNSNGGLQWQRSYGSGGDDHAWTIEETTDGGYLVVGYVINGVAGTASGHVTTAYGQNDIWVIKLDSSGDLEWERVLGSTAGDLGTNGIENSEGYLILGDAGNASGLVSSSHGNTDIWLVQLDPNGEILWERTYGGSGEDRSRGLAATPEGGYVISGWSRSINGDLTNNEGLFDVWIVKVDAVGELQWQRSLGGSEDEHAFAVTALGTGGYAAYGTTLSSDGDFVGQNGMVDSWLLRLGPDGISTGIRSPHLGALELFPNPARDEFFIAINGYFSDVDVTLCDMSGRIVRVARNASVSPEGIISIRDLQLNPGSYYVHIGMGNATRFAKLMVQ